MSRRQLLTRVLFRAASAAIFATVHRGLIRAVKGRLVARAPVPVVVQERFFPGVSDDLRLEELWSLTIILFIFRRDSCCTVW
jgi:hypothetical protein